MRTRVLKWWPAFVGVTAVAVLVTGTFRAGSPPAGGRAKPSEQDKELRDA
jgi:hypothetical protein